jgi:hypothetical protein
VIASFYSGSFVTPYYYVATRRETPEANQLLRRYVSVVFGP